MTTKLAKLLALGLCLLMLLPALALATETGTTPNPTQTPKPTPTPRVTATPRPVVLATGAPTFGSMDPADLPKKAAEIKCKFKMSEGKPLPMLDSKLSTAWKNKKAKAKIQITLPAGEVAGGLYIEWGKKPGEFTIAEFDAGDQEIASTGRNISYIGLVNFYPLTSETRKIVITFQDKGTAVSTLRVFSEGELPTGIQDWNKPVTKADLLVVAAHQGDEFLFFGGAIPYYTTVEGKQVQVLYMANGGRGSYKEALNGLWASGLRNYPEFLGFRDVNAKTLKAASKAWNADKVREALVDKIRRYKPEVVLSHDLKGENGEGVHMLTANILKEAVEQAADPAKYKKSADKYGVWQAQKLYLHLYNENTVTMDWASKFIELDNRTPSEIARAGFNANKSFKAKLKYEEGGKYDNAAFGLAYSDVGQDQDKKDLFENITESADDYQDSLELNTDDTENVDYSEPLDGEESLDDEPMDDADETFGADPTDGPLDLDGALAQTAGTTPPPPVNPPTDTAPKAPVDPRLIGLLVGVPAVLGGSAYGYGAYRKFAKKQRKAKRKAQRLEGKKTADV